MRLARFHHQACLALLTFVASARALTPNLESNIDRPLRYTPKDGGFVIVNGRESFNRPLYGASTAFRVDAGDRPEFSLYLPGKGGVLRVGVKTDAGAKWLIDADRVVATYRAGTMTYDVTDKLLGSGSLRVTALSPHGWEGLMVRAEGSNVPAGIEFLVGYGGASGEKGRRDGDIGTEREPVLTFFSLQPADCRGNRFKLSSSGFEMTAKVGMIEGILPGGCKLSVSDASKWNSSSELLAGKESETPVVMGAMRLEAGRARYLVLRRGEGEKIEDAAALFAAEENYWAGVSRQITVETPDEFVNSAAGALCLAADGIWDEKQGVFMHGAVAWRRGLLGWRGQYAADALGQHDRLRRHLEHWFGKQNLRPATRPVSADEDSNLARSERALHSDGDLTNSHYDMNLVAIDALFRHLMWTGDRQYARRVWPVIVRHLAWERRLFRREFGEEKLPLYEAYACIWASDDLQYSGGGVAHASSYNYFHNLMAARVAEWIGEDATPYRQEADLIFQGIQKYLWLEQEGHLAESKDLLGRQSIHPAAALWTWYHAVDSLVLTQEQATRMGRYVDQEIPHIPLRGEGVPPGYFTMATTNWHPYMWSTNNVVMAEVEHAALADFQAGRSERAFAAFKGAILDSMYMGICPGNVGMCTQFDVYRRESQRDFADGVGVTSRALVEGLFGVRPDAIKGELVIRPGFPAEWDHATLEHPDVTVAFHRAGDKDIYKVESRFPRPMTLRIGVGETEVVRPAAEKWTVELPAPRAPAVTDESKGSLYFSSTASTKPAGTYEPVDLAKIFNNSITSIFKREYLSPRSPFCSLSIPKHGIGGWCTLNSSVKIDDAAFRGAHGKLSIRGIPFLTPAEKQNVAFVSMWDNDPHELVVPLLGKARDAMMVMAGSTTNMQSRMDNGEVVATYADGTTARLGLHNPTSWWPIEQDYFVDDYAFRIDSPMPVRVDLKTGRVRSPEKGKGGAVDGGSATLLSLTLDPTKELTSLTVRSLCNESVIGLMSLTLERP